MSEWDKLYHKMIDSKYHYFHTDNGVLLRGDCLEVMRLLPDRSVDLVLTDPPYGIGIAKDGRVGGPGRIGERVIEVTQYPPADWDKSPVTVEQVREIMRVGKNQILFGFNYYLHLLSPTHCVIVWDKKRRMIGTITSQIAS